MSDENSSEPLVKKPKRGRPRNIDAKSIFNSLLKFKDRLSPSGDGKLVSKKNNVWKDIVKDIRNVKTEAALYAYVSCNQDDVRRKLWTNFEQSYESPEELDDDPEDSDLVDELLEKSALSCNADDAGEAITFVINVPAIQFDKLVETRVTYLHNKQPRRVKRFLKGDWQHFITEKIWGNTRLKCGWNFKYHHLNTDCSSGVIKGSCHCGSELNCIIERNDDIVIISCSTVVGKEDRQCGKRYIRGTVRSQLGDKLRGKSAHVVRARMADEMMEENDPEPPHLPASPTMRTIKSQRRKQEFLHPNPIMAIDVLGSSIMKDEIPWIGYRPFFVHWSTKHQRTLYEKMASQEGTTLVIDATSSIFTPIIRVDGSKTGPLFLYIGVLGTASKQYTVTQMISEIHTTGAIQFWLEQWIERWGSVPPREVISDCSSALLGALVRVFSKNDTVNEYADECFADPNTAPYCYIRIDIAHIMKIFATLLRDVRREVAKFYMVAIGKLTLCRTKEEAERLVRALLTITRSANCGNCTNGRISACEKQKRFFQKFITTNVMEEVGLDDDFNDQVEGDDLADQRSRAQPSLWREWGKKIDISVKGEIDNSPGTEINAHWLPQFADQLIERLKWLPLWSCITRDNHGYGRCPASSAIVEAEFGIIKNLVLKDADLPMRPDEFIKIHKSYVDGQSKLKEADIEAERQRCARRTVRGSDDEVCSTRSIPEGDHFYATRSFSNFDTDGHENQASRISPFQNITAHSSSIEESTTETRCPACENGDMPRGAHRCMICDVAVHVFEPCSLPIEGTEEGYGQKRVCLNCFQKPNAQKLIESRAFENWGNQVKLHEKKSLRMASDKCAKAKLPQKELSPKDNEKIKKRQKVATPVPQSRGIYLQATYNADQFLLTGKLASVPILKSGSEIKLKPIRKGDKKIDFINTCAFDSLFQLTLTVSFDSERFFKNSVESNAGHDSFMTMVHGVHKQKITMATYRQRADILSDLFAPAGHPEVNCLLIKCDCTVATICRKIYKNIPCFEETATCSASCPPRINCYPLLAMTLEALTSSAYNTSITDQISVDRTKKCPNDACNGVVTTVLKTTARRLNEYVRHYEPLSYSTDEVHRNHLRAKRSVTRDNAVNLKFRSHGRDFHLRLKRDITVFSDNLVIEGPSGEVEDLDTSHIYKGHLIGEPESHVFGSISDGVFHGKIVSPRGGAWYVERAHYYFPPHALNDSLHSVIYHENDVGDPYANVREGDSSGCGITDKVAEWMDKVQNAGEPEPPPPPQPKSQNFKEARPKVDPWDGTPESPGHKYTREANNPNHRRSRRATRPKEDNKNTCSLFIQTDPFIWRHISEHLHGDPEKTREEILSLIAHHVTAVNYIYRDTRFDGRIEHRNIKFEVQRIKIDNDTACTTRPDSKPSVFCMENIDVSNFLNQHSLGNHEDFCLAYVFTYRDFTGGTLGLAWVASASGASGGICEKYKTYTETVEGMYQSTKRSLNTGIITFVNYNSRVPPKVSQLTLAHEIGHNFGSPHDFPPECRPGGLHGNYIMFASATSGDRPNNSKFSKCSIGNISNVLDAIEDNKKRNCFTASAGAFCGNKIVEAGEECDCGYDNVECVDKCCYPRQISAADLEANSTAKSCARRKGTQCSPSQGPCCSSETCQFVPYKEKMQCKAESDCSYNATCNGKSSECPNSLPRANKTRCNEGTQLCINGECTGSICLEWNLTECFLTSNIIPNIDKRKLCELACQNGTDTKTCRSTSEFANIVGLPKGGISLRPGSPCDNFQGYCDVFFKCRAVDAEGPLARLKNLLFNQETLSTLREWMTEFWWAVLLMCIAFMIFMGLFIKCCAVHTPSSNPKKPPARRISDTLRRPMNTLRRMRHPHGGGHGPGPRSIPPNQTRGGHGTRGPSHGYGEGRGAQYYPKGYRSVPTASAPPSAAPAGSHGRSNHPELYAGAYSGSGGGGRGTAYEMRHHLNKV